MLSFVTLIRLVKFISFKFKLKPDSIQVMRLEFLMKELSKNNFNPIA
jgi:hypothetical protein